MRYFFALFLFLSSLLQPDLSACTTAVISGKYTRDGRPLLFKHRDSSFDQNKLVYFNDGTYNYIGLVNSADTLNLEVWGGCNSAGFAIINSASYNLKMDDDTTSLADQEGFLMKLALQECATIDDFENLLNSLEKPLGIEANFGVIDAQGGAAYFETNNFSYKKIDANDPSIAPFGYIIRTNYSFNGEPDQGYGYIRYLTAENLFYEAAASNSLDPEFILQNVDRCLKHSLTGADLSKNLASEGKRTMVPFEDFIPRSSSVSSILVQGVKPNESPELAAIWTVIGFPLTSIAVPVWVRAGSALPSLLTAGKNGNAPLCEKSLELKKKCFPITRGSGMKYININALLNKDKTGILQLLKPVEDKIISETRGMLAVWRANGHLPKQEVLNYYKSINLYITQSYKKLFGL